MQKLLIGFVVILSALFGAVSVALAFGEPGQWSSGYAQGTTEYVAVDNKGNQLYIACSLDTNVRMILTANGKEYGSYDNTDFDLIIDGKEFQTPYSEARSAQDVFKMSVDAMRKAKLIQAKTADGKLIVLPTKNASKILPKSTSKDFECKTEW